MWIKYSEGKQEFREINQNYTPLQEGSEYILFLAHSEGTNSYWVNSLSQGKFNVDKQDKVEEEIMEYNDQYSKLKLDVLKTFNLD